MSGMIMSALSPCYLLCSPPFGEYIAWINKQIAGCCMAGHKMITCYYNTGGLALFVGGRIGMRPPGRYTLVMAVKGVSSAAPYPPAKGQWTGVPIALLLYL